MGGVLYRLLTVSAGDIFVGPRLAQKCDRRTPATVPTIGVVGRCGASDRYSLWVSNRRPRTDSSRTPSAVSRADTASRIRTRSCAVGTADGRSGGVSTEVDAAERYERLAEELPGAKLACEILEVHGSLTQREIREESLLPARTVASALPRLRDDGLVESRCDPADPAGTPTASSRSMRRAGPSATGRASPSLDRASDSAPLEAARSSPGYPDPRWKLPSSSSGARTNWCVPVTYAEPLTTGWTTAPSSPSSTSLTVPVNS